jgi:hypothetical protein
LAVRPGSHRPKAGAGHRTESEPSINRGKSGGTAPTAHDDTRQAGGGRAYRVRSAGGPRPHKAGGVRPKFAKTCRWPSLLCNDCRSAAQGPGPIGRVHDSPFRASRTHASAAATSLRLAPCIPPRLSRTSSKATRACCSIHRSPRRTRTPGAGMVSGFLTMHSLSVYADD